LLRNKQDKQVLPKSFGKSTSPPLMTKNGLALCVC